MASLLSTKDFLELVWPAEGPYCLATPWVNQAGAEVFAHRAFDDVDDAIAAAQGMCFGEKKHVFFCVHTLVVARAMNPKSGKFKTYRTHENMKKGKAFFFDLDVGDYEKGKPRKFKTQQDAWNGLDQFLFRTCLPNPYVVSSGGGLHVYWIVDEPLPSVEWRRQADKLRHIAECCGLTFDPMRTTDQSSVLRVPGTINYKPDVQRRVQVLRAGVTTPTDELIAQFDKLAGETYQPLAPLVHQGGDNLMGGQFEGRLTPLDEVFEVCEIMREFRDNKGVVSEPHYYGALGLGMWAEDGEALMHEIAAGDPRYDFDQTQTKMEQWRDKGPPTCSKLNLSVGGDACQRCPNAGKGRNPLDIANKVWAETAVQPTLQLKASPIKAPDVQICNVSLPFSYSNGGCFVTKQDPQNPMQSRQVRFLPYKLFPIEQFKGTPTEPGFSRWAVELPLEGQRIFTFPEGEFATSQSFMQALLNVGIIVPDNGDLTLVRKYMLHYLRDLQRHTQAQVTYDHLGWVYNDDDPALDTGEPVKFVLNAEVYNVGDAAPKPCAMSTHTDFIKPIIKRRGNLQDQIALMDFYNQDFYKPHQFMAMCSLGSVIFRGTGEHGLIVAAVGETGASKSTALYLAASLWGDYKKYVINGTPEGSTVKARDDMIMAFQNLPVCIDEITLFEQDDLRSLVMNVNQPLGKITMTSDRRQRKNRGGIKSNMLLVTSNGSLHQLINLNNTAGQAGTVRVLEIFCEKEGIPHTKAQADRFKHDLLKHFGHIGPAFVSGIMGRLDRVDAKLRSEQERIDTRFGLRPEERFYSSGAASALTAGRYAQRMGLHPYDMDALEEWFGDVLLPKMRARVGGEIARTMPHEILANYMDAINGETLKIELDNVGNLGGVLHVPHGAISARLDVSTKEIWLRTDRFGEYCARHGFNRDRIITACEKSGLIKAVDRRTLTKGLDGQERMRTTCYVIDLTHKQAKPLDASK